jgi:glycosyltransferase involved in cell wall biosynthesis
LESIAEGKPFLGFNSGAFSEIIENGENGFICNNMEEMKKAIRNISENKITFNKEKIKLGAQEIFGQEKYYKNLMEIFKSVK